MSFAVIFAAVGLVFWLAVLILTFIRPTFIRPTGPRTGIRWVAAGMLPILSNVIVQNLPRQQGWPYSQRPIFDGIWLAFAVAGLGCDIVGVLIVIRSAQRTRRRPGRPADESHRSPLQPPAGIPDDVVELVRQGKKIQAIKRYRKLNSDLGLKQAKEHIDLISLTAKPDHSSPRS